MFFAALTALVSCSDDNQTTQLDEVKVSASYIAIPLEGGTNTITLTAANDWRVEKIVTKKDSVKWLTISAEQGTMGETQLSFTAPATLDGRTAEVLIHCGGQVQRLNILQGLPTVSNATVADVNAGVEGKLYRVTGTCTAIANTQYGNWYITDKTGTLYIYGTLDAKGATKNFTSLGIEIGDEITVEGPKSVYKGTPQLVNVTVVKINKSLIKVDSLSQDTLAVEGGTTTAYLTCKGQGVSVQVPEDAKSWLSIDAINTVGNATEVVFKAAPNTGGDRNTTITFQTTDGSKPYTSQAKLTQKGSIVQASIADFLAAAVGDTQYRLSGIITKVASSPNGNFDLTDFSGKTYVYKLADFATKGLKEGDIVTIVGKRGDYKGTPQVVNGVLETVNPVTAGTIAEVLTKPDSKTTFYKLTGEITNIANETYGNMTIKDGDSEIYIYGCMPGYGATGDARKGLVAAKGLKVGDQITVVAYKDTYKNTVQLNGCSYISHVSK